MNKLKSKTFLLIWTLINIFSFSIIFAFNYQVYEREQHFLNENFEKIINFQNKFDKNNRLPFFIDSQAYVVYFENNEISKIVSYTPNGLTQNEIEKLAQEFKEKESKNNLYFDDYVYSTSSNKIVIIDNATAKRVLIVYLRLSIILFLIIEILSIYISKKLTNWLVEPVVETFDKQRQFIYDISHELKTPLSVITANAEMIKIDNENKKWVNNIKNESNRMNKLVISLLDLLMSNNMNEKEKFTKINISKCIETSILTFESLIYENDLYLNYSIDENINFYCNPERIKQLVGILLDNAIKHGKKKSKITVNLKNEKDSIILSVRNRGAAIPKEEREKIFERFYRIDKSRNRNENRYGLGLAIAKNITEIHNGKISVNCASGYTTFTVILKK